MTTALVLVSLLVTLSCAMLLLFGARPTPPGPWDAIVVAGCRVYADGRPSSNLARRVQLAVDLQKQGVASRVLFTGGATGSPKTEASSAAHFALHLGLTDADILLEEESRNTRQNAEFSARILGPDARVLVVTDIAHALRCQRLFRRHFRAAAAVGAPIPLPQAPHSALRELGANLLETVRR